MAYTYVLDMNKNPLMPCHNGGFIRTLLKKKKAKVVRNKPFTVQLLFEVRNKYKQDMTLGVDAGYKHKYTKKEVDFFLCYDIKTKLVFMIDNTGDLSSAKIRYKKPKNNQTKNIRYYEDYLLTEDKIFNLVL